ncbi:Alanine racemase [compost metagenome]
MQESYRPTAAEIDLDALRANYESFRRHLPADVKLMVCVKGNAYGHGAVDVTRELETLGVDYVSVAFLDEAIQLRQAGIALPILVLGYTPPEAIPAAWEYDVTITLFTPEVLEAVAKLPEGDSRKLKVHIKIDSGMGRLGLLPAQAPNFIKQVCQVRQADVEGMFTHFARADEADKGYTLEQYRRFMSVTEALRENKIHIPIIHTGNSATAIDTPELSPNMLRVGVSIYGFYPSTAVNRQEVKLQPVMTLKTQVVYVKSLPEGWGISYGTHYRTDSGEYIATLPIGYADGYSRLLSGKAEVLIRGRRVPVVGTICMDQCMVSLKSFADEAEQIKAGEEVVLIGRQAGVSVSADELASLMGTIHYELVCMLANRVPRIYIRQGSAPKLVNALTQNLESNPVA